MGSHGPFALRIDHCDQGANIAMSNSRSALIQSDGDAVPALNPTDYPVRAIVSIAIGNAFEWFDIAIYGFLAITMSKLFFPTGDDKVSLLLALGTFGLSFVIRPLGSIVLG